MPTITQISEKLTLRMQTLVQKQVLDYNSFIFMIGLLCISLFCLFNLVWGCLNEIYDVILIFLCIKLADLK